jgi:mRNA-degrading endonuclease RelE of RelBE toxin-antitoxin system/DNA-binding XRE family transcriptional regulator
VKAIVFTASASRQWIELSSDVRRRIDGRLVAFAKTGKGDVKRLTGRAGVRLRVGDWRVTFDETATEIVVVAVGHRRDIYNYEQDMNVRFQKTPDGEVAILPRDDYEALVAKAAEADEDVGTARLVSRARKEIAAGAPLLPKQVADRLAAGESPIRVFREWRDITQPYLSFKTGISQSHVSDIENGRRTGTLTVLRKIANALSVPVDLLVP